MSLDIAEAPAPVQSAVTHTESLIELRDKYLPLVLMDIKNVEMHAVPGKRLKRIITPARAPVRDANMSAVQADISHRGCRNSVLLYNLYRTSCPQNMEVSFNYESSDIFVNEVRETVMMMVVYFLIPGEKRNRRQGRPTRRE